MACGCTKCCLQQSPAYTREAEQAKQACPRLQRQNEYKRTYLESCARLYTSRRRASLTHLKKSNNTRIRVCLFIFRLAGSKRILAYSLRATPSQRCTPKHCPWALLHSAHPRTCVRAARSSYPHLSHVSSLLLVQSCSRTRA